MLSLIATTIPGLFIQHARIKYSQSYLIPEQTIDCNLQEQLHQGKHCMHCVIPDAIINCLMFYSILPLNNSLCYVRCLLY